MAEYLTDGRVKTNVMLGLWNSYERGSQKWAECVAMHIQKTYERLQRDGDPYGLIKALEEAFKVEPPPWTLWPEEAKGNPESWIVLVSGHTWAEVSFLVQSRSGREAWEPFAQALQVWEAHPEHGRKPGNPTGANQYSGGTGCDTSNSSDPRDHVSARGIRRRLQKRANDGDEQAQQLVTQLAEGQLSANQAAIAAGMRQEYLRVRKDDPAKAAAAIIERMGVEWAAQLTAHLTDTLTA